MGLFATFSYVDGRWVDGGTNAEPSLTVDIHDSDIATVDYRPSLTGTGRFYLGCQPRIYFDDEAASGPVDAALEATAFAEWLRAFAHRPVDPATVQALLAGDDEDEEPVDVFVEDTVIALLTAAGLPLPTALSGEPEPVAESKPTPRRGWFRRRS